MKTEQKLFQLLKEMASNQEYLFDEGTADYILGRIPESQLMTNSFEFSGLKNFRIQTNLMGFILLRNSYKIQDNDFENINQWTQLLNKKNQKLTEEPQFVFYANQNNYSNFFPKLNKEKIPTLSGNFATFYALMHFEHWMQNQEKHIFNKPLKDINSLIFTLDSIANEQKSNFFFKDEDKVSFAKIFINHIIVNKNIIIQNKWHDDPSFTAKVMSSNILKRVMVSLESEQLEQLFSSDSLGVIIRQSNDFNNLKLNHQLLSNLLALAPAEKWLHGWKSTFKVKSKELNIIELFNNKFFRSYGLNIVENKEIKPGIRKETNSTNKNCMASFKDEFSFFLPAIKNMIVSNEQHCHLFNSIMRTNDVELMFIYRQHFDVPSFSNDLIYDKMIGRINSKNKLNHNNENWTSWLEYNTFFDANKLNKELSISTLNTKRTLKI